MTFDYEARFTGSGDPRRCVVSALAPADTYLSFETVYTFETITTVRRRDGRELAAFRWLMGSAPGQGVVGGRRVHMADFAIMQGYPRRSRAFESLDTDETLTRFVWRRVGRGKYDLYTQHDIRIGQYVEASQIQDTPDGPVYASFRFSFDHEVLFLDAMLALCVNRWIDEMILHTM
ncbi:hypothetical protein PENSPDRAFT_391880 [Peniophora sp. CONT]|nr:hypothetical protein PENSPDRAFT_391880 [Peniophora sp. CONT]